MNAADLFFGVTTLHLPHVDYTAILPELIALGGSLVLLAASALSPRRLPHSFYASVTSGIGIASLIASLFLYHDVAAHGAFMAIAHSVNIDGFAVFVLTLASCVLIVAPMFAAGFLEREGIVGCEFYALACVAVGGAMLMGTANDLILIFVSLEVLSIPLYILAGLDHRREGSAEAAMKYFLLGAFSSAIFVYGIALVYGATGSTNLAEIAAFLAHNVLISNGILYGGMAMLLVGFAFKVAAVPFHMWTPDVYQGSPTPAVGFMAAIAKVGGFAAFLRVFISTFPTLTDVWKPAVWVITLATLLVGAIAALVQRDVKRMLAYSSINHAGFILLGLQAATVRGETASLYYLFVYTMLVLGSFGIIGVVGGLGDRGHRLERYRGLGRRRPVLATCFALLLLGQAGAPFTTGLFAKIYVVEAAASAHSYVLAVVAMLSAAIAAFFYLRVVFLMFGETAAIETPAAEPAFAPESPLAPAFAGAGVPGPGGTLLATAHPSPAVVPAGGALVSEDLRADPEEVGAPSDAELVVSPWTWFGLALTLGVTIVLGIWPEPLVGFAHQAHLLF